MGHLGQVLHACPNSCEKTLHKLEPAPWPQKLPKPAPACFGWGKLAKTSRKCTSACQGGFMPHHCVLAFRCTLPHCLSKVKGGLVALHPPQQFWRFFHASGLPCDITASKKQPTKH